MSSAEQEVLVAIYELGGGQAPPISFDKLAERMATTITAVKTIALLLQNRKLAMVTFGGVQLTATGLDQAKYEREIYSD